MTNNDAKEPWKRMSFKGNKVWARIDEKQDLLLEDDKVLIKYNLNQDYEYRVHPDSLKPIDAPVAGRKESSTSKLKQAGSKPEKNKRAGTSKINIEANIPEPCIKIYTDGASSGNPGPAGIGVVFIFEDKKKQVSRYIGQGTNNIAELTAIKVALEELKRQDLPVRIFSDSSYAIGLLTKGWKPQKNQELVYQIKNLMLKFSDLAFIKVKGHSGIKENEVADFLATSAIKKGLE
ncbi:MAG: ribonuclease H [Pseudomonadota bacterium]